MHDFAKIGCGLLLAAAVVGCHSTVNTVTVGDQLGTQYRWIQTDAGLSRMCKVVSAKKTRNDAGLLVVQVDLTSTLNHTKTFVYKYQWFDASGMELTSVSNDWLPKVIHGKETITLSQVAPDARATECRLLMQESVRHGA